MRLVKSLAFYLVAAGFGLLISGFVLSLLLSVMEVSKEGPAGMLVAIPLGVGLCVLLFAFLLPRKTNSVPSESKQIEPATDEHQQRVATVGDRHAKVATCFSAGATLLAFALFFGGIPVAFIGFNFASGTNEVGLILMLTGMVVAALAILSVPIALFFSAKSALKSGRFGWLILALGLPFSQAGVNLVGTYLTK